MGCRGHGPRRPDGAAPTDQRRGAEHDQQTRGLTALMITGDTRPESARDLVGHLVRSSVLCGPASCREVDHVAATNESVARLECGGADGVDAVEPVAAYAGGSGRAGGGVAGG